VVCPGDGARRGSDGQILRREKDVDRTADVRG
jgi:hypothetical protein